MDDNKLRTIDRYNRDRLHDELEEERFRKERGLMDSRYGWENGYRK